MITSLVSVRVGMIVGTMLSPGTVQRQAEVNSSSTAHCPGKGARFAHDVRERGFSPVRSGHGDRRNWRTLAIDRTGVGPSGPGIWSIGVGHGPCARWAVPDPDPQTADSVAPTLVDQKAD